MMTKLENLLKKDYVVHIEITAISGDSPLRSFDARIKQVIEDIEQGVMITYDRLDGQVFEHQSCNASWVTDIIDAAPYVCEQKVHINPFLRHTFNGETYGGVKVGFFRDLLSLSLSKLDIDFETWMDQDLALKLYEKAYWPGKTEFPIDAWMREHGVIAVRFKTFHRWVRQNAHRFFWTKKRQRAEIKRQNAEAYARDYEHIVDDDEREFNQEFDAVATSDDYFGQGQDSFFEDI